MGGRARDGYRTTMMRRIDEARALHERGIDLEEVARLTSLSPYMLDLACRADAIKRQADRDGQEERNTSYRRSLARRHAERSAR